MRLGKDVNAFTAQPQWRTKSCTWTMRVLTMSLIGNQKKCVEFTLFLLVSSSSACPSPLLDLQSSLIRTIAPFWLQFQLLINTISLRRGIIRIKLATKWDSTCRELFNNSISKYFSVATYEYMNLYILRHFHEFNKQ